MLIKNIIILPIRIHYTRKKEKLSTRNRFRNILT